MKEPNVEFLQLAEAAGLPLSRQIALSRKGYRKRHPQHAVMYLATIANAAGTRLWWGDINLTVDEEMLVHLAELVGFDLLVYDERASSGRLVDRLESSSASAVFHPDGTVTLGTRTSYFRTPFGRIIRASRP